MSGFLSAGIVDGGEIPDSVVSRPDDNNTINNSDNVGLAFSTSQQWPDFQAEISSNTSPASDETLVIGDTNGTDVATKDISGAVAGDIITLSDVNLSANESYSIYIRSSNSRDFGDYDSPSFPYNSSDGNLSITSGWSTAEGGAVSFSVFAIKRIGNITL